MRKRSLSLSILFLCFLAVVSGFSQSGKGAIGGVAKDAAGAVLQGAKVEFKPQVRPVTTDGQGEFTVNDVAPGTYAATISYVGFAPYTGTITVVAGQTARVDAVLKVSNVADEVTVLGEPMPGVDHEHARRLPRASRRRPRFTSR